MPKIEICVVGSKACKRLEFLSFLYILCGTYVINVKMKKYNHKVTVIIIKSLESSELVFIYAYECDS